MHIHCEVLIPPTANVEESIVSVMRPFDENAEGESHGFWDFYVIGGRFAGNKLMAKHDPVKIDEFYEWMTAEKITVSGIQYGKQELSPPSQRDRVDAKWNEMFPGVPPIPCPIFNHSNDQYGRRGDGSLPGDVMPLRDVPERLRIGHVIIAGGGFNSDASDWSGPLEAKFMLRDAAWNGVNHMPVKWDGSVADALAQYRERLARDRPKRMALMDPTDDWLLVTVDYHS